MNEAMSSQRTEEVPGATGTPSKILSDLTSRVAALEHRPEKTDFQSWTAVVTLSALAIYGAARFGDRAFYARLGTDPDTVGLNYGVTLARVATSVVVAGAGVVALFSCGRHFAKPADEKGNQGPWAKLFFGLCLVMAFILSFLLLVLVIPTTLVPIVQLRGCLALALVGVLCLAGYGYEKARRKAGSFDPLRSIVGFAIAIVLLFGFAALTGYQSAGHIMRGQPLPCPCISFFGRNVTLPWSSGTNGFLGIIAEQAKITWIGPGRSPVPGFAIFLGGSNDSVVLFDVTTQHTLIVSNTDVIVTPFSNLTGWNER
jgi:uncharacterized membrane-anchored protein